MSTTEVSTILVNLAPAGEPCDVKTYAKYVCGFVASLTWDQIHELCRQFRCPIDELIDRIVAAQLGKSTRKRKRRFK